MDDSQISILVCPDQNMTDSDLRHLLLQLEIQFFALTYYQGFAAIEFATTSALIAASQHPSLTGFKLLKVKPYVKKPLRAINLPENISVAEIKDLFLTTAPMEVSLNSSTSKISTRPSATLTFGNDADYEKARKTPFINYFQQTMFLEPLQEQIQYKAVVSGIPNGYSEQSLGRALAIGGIKACYWHLPHKPTSARTISAFLRFRSEEDLNQALKVPIKIDGAHPQWVIDKMTCLECHQPNGIHMPRCSHLRFRRRK